MLFFLRIPNFFRKKTKKAPHLIINLKIIIMGKEPTLIIEEDLWGNITYLPVTREKQPQAVAESASDWEYSSSTASTRFGNYMNKRFLPPEIKVEGKEEIPCVLPFIVDLPQNIVGIDERIPSDCSKTAVHGFCSDRVLWQKWNNLGRAIAKAKHYYCAFGFHFSVLMDGSRCEAIEAIRMNRVATLAMQYQGIPTIPTVSLTCAKYFEIAYDGLPTNSPIAFENMCVLKDPQLSRLYRMGVEQLIERKNPTVLVVVGNQLNFDPGIPVVYYKSRIQKLRDHDYSK